MGNTWDDLELLVGLFGSDVVLDALARALSDQELRECLDWIFRTFDVQSPDDLIVEDEISRLNMGFGTHDLDESFAI